MFPSPIEFFSGLFGESASSKQGSDFFGTFIDWAIFIVFCIALTEPIKLILRRNIGAKALNIYWTILSAAIFLLYAIALLVVSSFLSDYNLAKANWTGLLYHRYMFYTSAILYVYLAFYVLNRGMNEYYRSRAINSQTIEELEYRGDSIFMRNKLIAGKARDIIWRSAEPKACLLIAIMVCIINVLMGLPLLIASISFWINEWYQVHYKDIRMRESFRNMKIEAEKANTYYNDVASHEPVSRVIIED